MVAQLTSPIPGRTAPRAEAEPTRAAHVILSFDVEEHYRIEAAAGLSVSSDLQTHCRERLDVSTRRLIDVLEQHDVQATFFVVASIVEHNPSLVKAIARAGHEVASHGWDHQRIHRFTKASFRDDVRTSKDALEQVAGQRVFGYRAPTFSLMQPTAWAIDVLAECGLTYDSSIYPVRHDRYGVPQAPRGPFVARGPEASILELPPVTLRLCGMRLPMGGGGYFRLFPLWMTLWAVRQTLRDTNPAVAMLYFHPWEFDVGQRRLALSWRKQVRTYVGIERTLARLEQLLGEHQFTRAVDAARTLESIRCPLPRFRVPSSQ